MKSQACRTLVFVSRTSGQQQLHDTLRQSGWNVAVLGTAQQVKRYLSKAQATVGVFDFASGFSAAEVASFKSSFISREVGWVGLLGAGQLANEALRDVIRGYFSRYLTLPCEMERIVEAVGHEHGMILLNDRPVAESSKEDIVGACAAMKELFRSISKVANTDASVLILGESGTGKELTANAIHKRSIRRNGPFIAINCGGLPHQLVQSALFGYERGAFTGAYQRKIGRIESAHGGTLFLDEIGDLPLESQAVLLRFLQERKIQRLGSTETLDVDVRVISATNVSLEKAVAEGTFRADLYHRLCVLNIVEPPLRERGTDIELLAHHILDCYLEDGQRLIRGFSDCAVKAMYTHQWPGNVRELVNRVRRAIVMGEGRVITAVDLELETWSAERDATLNQVRAAAELEAIESALMRHGDRPHPAARELGISRATLYRLMANHGARRRDHDQTVVASSAGASQMGHSVGHSVTQQAHEIEEVEECVAAATNDDSVYPSPSRRRAGE